MTKPFTSAYTISCPAPYWKCLGRNDLLHRELLRAGIYASSNIFYTDNSAEPSHFNNNGFCVGCKGALCTDFESIQPRQMASSIYYKIKRCAYWFVNWLIQYSLSQYDLIQPYTAYIRYRSHFDRQSVAYIMLIVALNISYS